MAGKGNTKRKDKDRIVLKTGESQRKNGTYDYRWTDRNGKRHVVYAKTLEELREKEKEIEKNKIDGLKAEARYIVLDELFSLWKQLKRGIKDNTFQNYIYLYDTFVRPYMGKTRIQTIKKSDVKKFYNYLADERNLMISTIDGVHTVLHQVLQMAVDDEYIRLNPSDSVLKELKQSVKRKSEKRESLTVQEQDLLLDFLKSHKVYNHWYPIVAVMLGTGLRVGEVTGLRWCDIDLENNMVDINHTLVYYCHRQEKEKHGCYFNVNTPKTEKSVRQIPMLGFVKEAFLSEKQTQEILGAECKVIIDGYTDFIFINKDGKAQHQGTLNKAFKRIIRDCNYEIDMKGEENPVYLPHFSCHILRHTFCTRMCEAGVNPKVIQDIMGHEDISTTMNIYTSVTNEHKLSQFVTLEEYFKKQNNNTSSI